VRALARALAVAVLALPAAAEDAALDRASPSTARGAIAVGVRGLRSASGSLRVKLVDSPEGFPASDDHVVAKRRLAISGAAALVVFEGVPYGDYALVVLHDEDDDGALDRGRFGIPSEGIAFSNGARLRFGPPSFEAARFTLAAPRVEMEVEVRY
jgi:uncharacterized protein (DUF2141 family)